MKKNEGLDLRKNIRELLTIFGENPQREGLRETPARVERMYKELLSGYDKDPATVFKMFSHETTTQDLITVSGLIFFSLCEHHLLPFYGQIHIGYVPNNKILGISKFGRLVEIFARRLQIQEKLTVELADSIMENLKPKGAIIYSSAVHLCTQMRGVRSKAQVSVVVKRGIFEKSKEFTQEFMQIIHK